MRFRFVICCCVLALTATAQKKKIVWGYLRDSVTQQPVVLASVTNINTNTTVMTGSTGRFSIALSEKQVLSFAAVGYYFDTIQYQGGHLLQDTLLPQLQPLARYLGNVTVRAKGYSQYQLDSMERRMDFLQDIANYTIPAVSQANSGAGIALNIGRFSRHERNKRKAFVFYESTEKEAYINYRFHTQLVKSYTGFRDEQLQQFIQQFRPSYEWLRNNRTEEDVKYYINEKLKSFLKKG